jgi:hypothetical protein
VGSLFCVPAAERHRRTRVRAEGGSRRAADGIDVPGAPRTLASGIDVPGAPRTLASGIDDRGRIAGLYENPKAPMPLMDAVRLGPAERGVVSGT